MSTWLHDARLVSLAAVAGALGHPVDRRGARCPLCQHEEACKAFASTRWHCHACGQGGDGVDLVCAVLTGERYHRRHIDAVRGWFASQGWCEAFGDSAAPVLRRTPPPPPPRVEATYPPEDEVAALLAQTVAPHEDADVARWMEVRRGLGDRAAERLALVGVRALVPRAVCPSWARLGERTWADLGYRCLIPQVDHSGVVRSVRARCVGDAPWADAPKALPPRGFRVGGLVAANRPGVRLLQGTAVPEVVVAEGEPGFMAACLRWPGRAVFGIVSGSWTAELGARVPRGALVTVATDQDEAGDRYAARIIETIHGCRVVRHEGIAA